MPEYELAEEALKVIVSFRSEEDRAEFARLLGLRLTDKTKATWYPPKERDDRAALLLEA
jgi:hypothetical protein